MKSIFKYENCDGGRLKFIPYMSITIVKFSVDNLFGELSLPFKFLSFSFLVKYIHSFYIKTIELRAHVLSVIIDHISKCIGIVGIQCMPSSIGQNKNVLNFDFMVLVELAKGKMTFVGL